jgi:predicted kinase
VLDDGPRILDCIEFGEQYRWGDVLSDVAFLAMDLERLGRPDLGERFLALHRELSADRWPASLAHHLVAYRAHVRVKVALLRASQHQAPVPAEVHDLVRVARRHLEAGRVRLVLVGGLPGTGKSTLAAGLGDHLGAVVLRTDEVRQRTAIGHDDAAEDRYRPETVAAVYREMRDEARRLLALGEHVVLDATWADEAERSLARDVAAQTWSDLVELVCTLPRDQADDRIRQRAVAGRDLSEATPAVAAAMATRFAPWREATAISTAAPARATLAAALELLEG